MLKKLILLLVTVLSCMQFSVADAAKEYNEEVNAPLGSYFGFQVKGQRLTILRGTASIAMQNGREYLYLSQLGDVLVNVSFNHPHNPGTKVDYKYLIHVVQPENMIAADRQLNAKEEARKAAIKPELFPQQVLDLVNKERAKVGARPLRLSSELQSAAMLRAREITQVMSHTRPNGKSCMTVLKSPWGAGENIAGGNETPEEVVQSWMDSPGHRRNILYPRFNKLGVGYCYDPNGVGGYQHYWVQLFQE
ncbi:MAG: CAP domain-containing protein [Phascolarctobacterium sp.]